MGKHRYTDEQIERGLLALALENGATTKASKLLSAGDLTIPPRTLSDWRTRSHTKRYEQIRIEVLPKIQSDAADKHRELAELHRDASREFVEDLRVERPRMSSRDKVLALEKFNVGSGIHVDKAQLLDGEPTAIIAHESASEILRALAAEGIHISDIEEAIDVESFDEPLQAFQVDDEHVLPSGESVA